MSKARLEDIEARAERYKDWEFSPYYCTKGDEYFVSSLTEAEMSHDEAEKAAGDIEGLIKDVPWLLGRIAELEGTEGA